MATLQDPHLDTLNILNFAGDTLIYSIDPNYRYQYFNKNYKERFTKLVGSKVQLGDNILEVFSDQSIQLQRVLDRALAGESFREVEEVVSLKSKEKDYFESSYNPIVREGKVCGVTVICTNVNDQIESKKLERNINIAAQYTQNGVVLVSSHGEIQWLNDTFTRLTGYTTNDPIVEKIRELIFPADEVENEKSLNKLLKENKPVVKELECTRKNGSTFWCETKITPIVDEKLGFDGFLIIMGDISARKAIEKELADNANWIRNINNSIPGAVVKYAVKPDGTDELLYISNQVKQVWGISKKKAMESVANLWARIYPEDVPDLQKSLEYSATNLSKWSEQWRIYGPGDELKWLDGQGNPYRLDDGTVVWDMIFIDISDLKSTQEALINSKERYKSILNAVDGVFWESEDEENFQLSFLSNKAKDILGYAKEQWMEDPGLWLESVDPDHRASLILSREEGRVGRKSYHLDYRMKRADDRYVWVRDVTSYSPIGEPFVARGFIIDITKQKELENKLKTESARAEGILNATKAGTWELDLQTKEVRINDRWAEMLGFKLSDFEPMSFEKFRDTVHPDDRPSVVESMEKHLSGETEFHDVEIRQKHKDGSWFWVHARGRVIEYIDGAPKRMSGTHIEINKRKIAELERRKAEEKLRNALHQLELAVTAAKIGVWHYNFAEDYPTWNKELYKIYDIDPEKSPLNFQEFMGLVQDEFREPIEQNIMKLAQGERLQDTRLTIKTSKGSTKHLLTSATPLFDENNNVTTAIGVNMDITHLVKTEESLRDALKGKDQLFKELHHRIKNNLQLVSSLLYLKSRNITDESTIDFVKDANSRILSIANIHEQLIHLEEQNQLFMKDYIEKLIDNLKKSYIEESGSVDMHLEIDNLQFNIDKAMLIGLIVHETTTNSLKYAFIGRDGGTITIRLKDSDDHYLLQIMDDGIGLDVATIKSGSSIGVQLVRDFVKQLKGTMDISSVDGCHYTIKIPKEDSSQS